MAYLVLANRDDLVFHQLSHLVEEEKGHGNFKKGKHLSPEAYGYPREMGVTGGEERARELDIEPENL